MRPMAIAGRLGGVALAVASVVLVAQLLTGAGGPGPAGFAAYLGELAAFSFGESSMTGEPVVRVLGAAALATAELCAAAAFGGLLAGWPIGRWLAKRPALRLQGVERTAALIPVAFLALALGATGFVTSETAPGLVAAAQSPDAMPAALAAFGACVATIGLLAAWTVARAVENASRHAAALPFVRAQRELGMPAAGLERATARHALRALLPAAGTALVPLLGWAMTAEAVIHREGLGALLLAAAVAQDAPVMAAVAVVAALAVLASGAASRALQIWTAPPGMRSAA